MSAAEEDTELRDLLIQNLENNGVLNKIKAELRAAVFLALEQQDREENKPPLVNESLKKFLNTKDGRLVASLVVDFLQVFSLDFTLAVFQPEINTLNGLENREAAARELDIVDLDTHKGAPLLLELIRRNKQQDKPCTLAEELSPRQIADARRKFDFCDMERQGEIKEESLRFLFSDLAPGFHKSVLDQYVTEEFRALDRNFSNAVSFQEFLGMYKRLFHQCRSVISGDGSDFISAPTKLPEEKMGTSSPSKIPRYKGIMKHTEEVESPTPKAPQASQSSAGLTSDPLKSRSHVVGSSWERKGEDGTQLESGDLEAGVDDDEGDSFFDDPLPKPQKTYGCPRLSFTDKSNAAATFSAKKNGHRDLSAINSDADDDAGDTFSDRVNGGRRTSEPDAGKDESKPADSPPSSLGDGPPVKSRVSIEPAQRGPPDRRSDEEDDYDDDFISTSHRSDNSKSEVSIGQDIDEISIEGPDGSDKMEELTQDQSVSQTSQDADYMEDVA